MTSEARSVLISTIAHKMPLIYLFNQWLEFTVYYFAFIVIWSHGVGSVIAPLLLLSRKLPSFFH